MSFLFYLLLCLMLIATGLWAYLKFYLGFFDPEVAQEWNILNEYIDLSDEELDQKAAEIRQKTAQALDLLKLATVGQQVFELSASTSSKATNNQGLISDFSINPQGNQPKTSTFNQDPLLNTHTAQKAQSFDFDMGNRKTDKNTLSDLSLSASDFDLSTKKEPIIAEPSKATSTKIAVTSSKAKTSKASLKSKSKVSQQEISQELPDDMQEAKRYQQALLEADQIANMVLVTDIIKQARKHCRPEALEKHVLRFIESDNGIKKLISHLNPKHPKLTANHEKQIKILAGKFGELLTTLIFEPYFQSIQGQVHQKLHQGASFIDLVCSKAKALIILHDPETLIRKNKDCYIEVKCGQEGYLKNILEHLTTRQIKAHGENHSDGQLQVISLVVTSKDLRGSKVEAMFRSKVRAAGSKSWALLPNKSELDQVLRNAVIAHARQKA
jgi:hypothetical protein